MDYTSVVTKDQARIDGLNLQHGLQVFVTAIAYNAVGLHTKAVSHPVLIDKTPPSLCCVSIGNGNDVVKLVHLTHDDFAIHWHVDDPEYDIEWCQYAIGKVVLFLSKITYTIKNTSRIPFKYQHIIVK